MFALLGHTLGTPHLDVVDALGLFARAGLDGAELIWQDGYRSGLPETDSAALERVRLRARDLGLVVGCLTPYMTEINSLDAEERERDVRRFILCIRAAEVLGCARIRVYAGRWTDDDNAVSREAKWAVLVDSLGRLGEHAAKRGVTLCVENHFNTMADSAASAARLVAEVASPAVGVLYDQANLTFTGQESFEEAIALQGRAIRHVHVKDVELLGEARTIRGHDVHRVDATDRAHRSRIVGDGILDWRMILTRLAGVGYEGPLSIEYEYRWHPEDLPPPETGIPESAERLRRLTAAVAQPAPDERAGRPAKTAGS